MKAFGHQQRARQVLDHGGGAGSPPQTRQAGQVRHAHDSEESCDETSESQGVGAPSRGKRGRSRKTPRIPGTGIGAHGPQTPWFSTPRAPPNPALPRAVQRDVVCPAFWTPDRILPGFEMNFGPTPDILRALVFPTVSDPKKPLQKRAFHPSAYTLLSLCKHTFCGSTNKSPANGVFPRRWFQESREKPRGGFC